MRLGCAPQADQSRVLVMPSMRPKRVRLGCLLYIARPAAVPIRPSMRPKRVRLGCSHHGYHDGRLVGSFNEAEARAPRMPFRSQSEILIFGALQ